MSSTAQEVGRGLIGYFLLSEDGVIQFANDTACKWLGYTEEELLQHPLHTFLGAGGQFFLQSQVFPMLTLKGELEEIFLRLKKRGGQLVPILANVVRRKLETRDVVEFSFMRISQRGRLEDELLEAKKMAEQASDAKTKFLGMMSHELRTPLGAISLNNQLLLAGEFGKLPPDQEALINTSENCVQSVTVLIEDILNFAQMRGGSVPVAPQNLTIETAVARAEAAIGHRFRLRSITLRRGSVDPQLRARYDPNRTQQILLNLLNNALKFTPQGGCVSMSAIRDAQWAVIDITDTGCGIPPDQLSRIFEPFVQLTSSVESSEKKGVGLGLAICRDLVTAMGGHIRMRSEINKGSTFSVALPAIDGGGAEFSK